VAKYDHYLLFPLIREIRGCYRLRSRN